MQLSGTRSDLSGLGYFRPHLDRAPISREQDMVLSCSGGSDIDNELDIGITRQLGRLVRYAVQSMAIEKNREVELIRGADVQVYLHREPIGSSFSPVLQLTVGSGLTPTAWVMCRQRKSKGAPPWRSSDRPEDPLGFIEANETHRSTSILATNLVRPQAPLNLSHGKNSDQRLQATANPRI